jgi:alkanesulfonate monooxygenase SsuD/methylene tetrahydromethanopterin reductase-like flavin-dependent oxidoreductase (luciferase family)
MEMAEWDRNPPEEYRELFAEIDQAAAAYSASIEQGLKLSSQLRDAADDLDALAGELQQEAEELKTIEQAARKQRRARSLNGKDCQSWSLRLSKAAAAQRSSSTN